MIILVINCGSSSIKYQLLDMKNDDVFDIIAKGIAEKIGLPAGILQYAPTGRDKIVKDIPIPDHKVGMELILAALTDPETGVLSSLEDIEAVGHRIVQGGDFFSGSVLVDDDVLEKIAFCSDFAPLLLRLHVRPSVPVLREIPRPPLRRARHEPPVRRRRGRQARRTGPRELQDHHLPPGRRQLHLRHPERQVRGHFHGLLPARGHDHGHPRGQHRRERRHLPGEQARRLLGVSEYSSDCRELDERANNGDPKAKLALKKFTYDIIKNIGSYVAAMNGVDLIVFTGGIGEHNSRLRRRVLENFSYLGLKVDYEANVAFGEDAIITTADSKVKAALICTNEELVIARDTMHIALQNQD